MQTNRPPVRLHTETRFSEALFRNPPAGIEPVYAWCWNVMPSEEQTDRDLEEFRRLGIRSLYILPETQSFSPAGIPTTFAVEYLGKEYMQAYTYAVRKAIDMGFTLWLYDECGWPSGGAGGKVLLNHPEYARRHLETRTETYRKNEVFHAKAGEYAFAYDYEPIEDGFVFCGTTEVTVYYSQWDLFERPGRPDYPDILQKEATEEFLRLTHDAYRDLLGDQFGRAIKAMFTDEPTGPRPVPYSEALEKEFLRRTGYSIRPYLPELAGNRQPMGKAAEAVIAWFDMCSRLFCDNFMLTCRDWCRANGLAFLGHMDIDNKPDGSVQGGNFNIMRALRCFDVPGIDVIWRQIFPGKRGYHGDNIHSENRFFPRYAGSAAVQIGSQHAITESFGVFGNGLTFEQMRYVFNFQAIRGVNVLNPMLLPYGDDKAYQMTGEPPFLKEKFACYADLGVFNAYIQRVMYVTGLGYSASDVALYLPVRDFYVNEQNSEYCREFDAAGFQMEDAQIPFDIFDDDVILQADPAQLQKGIIAMGKARYTKLVITSCRHMQTSVQALLKEFIKSGGQVISVSGVDTFMLEGAQTVSKVTDALRAPLRFTGDTEGIRLLRRKAENAEIYCISNEKLQSTQVTVEIRQGAYLLDITNGVVIKPEAEDSFVTHTLASGELCALLYCDTPLETDRVPALPSETVLAGPYTIRRTKQFVIGALESYNKQITEAPQPAALGDWQVFAGKEYSGSCVYQTRFPVPAHAADAVLDLGDVRYTAEVFLNGESLGVRVMAPYTFEIKAEAWKDENDLEIRVSNTAANAYYYTDSFDKWPKWMLTPYHEKAQMFHMDSLLSGLYGPVRIRY